MLPANSVTEIGIDLKPAGLGQREYYVNLVDVEFHQLMRTWLITTVVSPPTITKVGNHQQLTLTMPRPLKWNYKWDNLRQSESPIQTHTQAIVNSPFTPIGKIYFGSRHQPWTSHPRRNVTSAWSSSLAMLQVGVFPPPLLS